MGIVGKFIDAACEVQPAFMLDVLHREFGPLNRWVLAPRGAKGPCGCLVGTMAIVAGIDSYTAEDDPDYPAEFVSETYFGELFLDREHDADAAGMRVNKVSARVAGDEYKGTPESDAVVTLMVKRRIARRLGVPLPIPAQV